jgi:hypothetical protein
MFLGIAFEIYNNPTFRLLIIDMLSFLLPCWKALSYLTEKKLCSLLQLVDLLYGLFRFKFISLISISAFIDFLLMRYQLTD